ncbi:ABC transporter substrate-binding protein [Conexibacter woesei]|uniref:ABC-type nitrate/sulfonate/bicarbonate transport systems periplasmic components-like protein n=1 Tax=Conexibacter woesei (strain DSM 14684 / CCUG 47730 / CIP 108061 / JCM 11494 / NBRC 100937 / ID131577) TaxID=469383 RepID=D3F4M8_CONWI|nr:ABC transporter substrate-binding protein [Conexibacter woesei]ADB52485.1 ABC-type nitrate/sulfonate/bicarbonate transport systems periplasmic components-like protein [Conexibacter woesei DSM 14684]
MHEIEGMPVRVAAFPSAGELALHAADARGLFAAAGLRVDAQLIAGQRPQFAGLRDGSWDVLHTAADNVLAHHDELDLIVVAGVNRGMLSLVADGDGGLAALRRRPIGVDSAASGYAVVLRHVLRRAGVAPEECTFAEVGGTRERAQALRDGTIAATLLTPPYDVATVRDGGHVVLRPTDVEPRYVGATVAVRRGWAEANSDVLRRYLGALADAEAWLRDPASRDAAAALAVDRAGAPAELAGDVVDAVLDPASGLLPGGRLDVADLASVLDVRRREGTPVDVDAAACLDLRYLPS